MGFVMIVTFMMMLGDPEIALDTPTGYPFIDVSWNNEEWNCRFVLTRNAAILQDNGLIGCYHCHGYLVLCNASLRLCH